MERAIRILAVMDSYRPMLVPARVVAACLREPRPTVQNLMAYMRAQGILRSVVGFHGGYQRARGTTFGELWNMLYQGERGPEPDAQIPKDIEAKVKATHYKIMRIAI